jgi:glutathione S-transferase
VSALGLFSRYDETLQNLFALVYSIALVAELPTAHQVPKHTMPVQSKLLEVLPANYGYVVLTVVGSTFVNLWLYRNVMKARTEYKVEYPDMYSKDSTKFNCIQRAHQNFLEAYPQFLVFLTLGGLQYPRISAGAGVVYLIGRIAYAVGYYTGEPKNRRYGLFGFVGMLTLLGNTVSFACHQLKWVGGCKSCH